MIDLILVPQGPEYRAICQGLNQMTANQPTVLPIPMGFQALIAFLEIWKQTPEFLNKRLSRVLLIGLGGSLSAHYQVGDVVLYQGCLRGDSWQMCDRNFTSLVYAHLQKKVSLVKGLTSDRPIWSAEEKGYLAQKYQADVVDMEGFTVLEKFNQLGIAVAILRVISDDYRQTLPNLTSALSSDGSLKPFPLAISLLRHPLAATRLIRSSLKGLKRLQQLTQELMLQMKEKPAPTLGNL